MANNPLLQKKPLLEFNKILPKHFKPALVTILKTNRIAIKKLLLQKNFTWDNFVEPLEAINNHLTFIWSAICHLNAVMGNEKNRASYIKCLPLITKYIADISQNSKIYEAFRSITKNKEYKLLDSVQKRILSNELRDFILAGVALPTREKRQFTKLKQRLAKISNKFSYNVIDSSQNYLIELTKEQTQGLPEYALALGQANARKKNKTGWIFSLDYPSYNALITFADSRSLRKKIYIAYVTRASDFNSFNKKWDNTKIIEEILKIRSKLAKLLSFKNYAEYSLATKMAKTPKQVLDFLHDLTKRALPAGKKDLAELKQFAKKHGIKKIEPWDLAYYEEKLSKEKFKLSQEDLRPYFPEPQVLKGVFNIAKLLYGITFKEKKNIPVWHQDVRFFEVYDQERNLRGQLYLDLYYRENKRGGAWMDECQTRQCLKNGCIQLPIAHLVCNFSPPMGNKPALLTHQEVLTLLHEFGHSLQHVLTKVDYISASGIKGVPWDAIELPSQFMENWGWQKEGIKLLSKHYKTKVPLPKNLLQKLLASHTFHAATSILRQIEFSLIDFELHLKSKALTIEQCKKIVRKTQKQTRVTPVFKHARSLHTFSHIFAGGYAAGYYSYKWAEVLSADAFSKFEECGIFDLCTGRKFLHSILETGGSEDPMVLFKKFRGRMPKTDALLRHYGINKK
ncbi:MAG TPA: oligopeptidase A [Coxiellaceae bacterium]|nr:oligopeptidase A [Coxiellaceae bacterium]